MSNPERDKYLMQLALEQAHFAQQAGEVPIGCVVARGERILAAAGNRRIQDSDPTAHAEILAIRQAAAETGDWRLEGCDLAVTLEPCCMCAGAIVLARLDRLIYGAADPKAGAVDTLYGICRDDRLNHSPEVVAGVLAEECGLILTEFFQARRAEGRK